MQDDATNPTEPYKFSSSSVSIACGGKVVITNNSSGTHTFSPTHGGFKDSGNMNPSSTVSVSFFFKGSYGFICSYHSWMTGTVHVT